jgi:hypothetical protein
MMSPRPLRLHRTDRRLAGVERAEQIDVDDPAPFLGRQAFDAARLDHPGRIDEDIDAAQPRHGRLDRADGLGFHRNVSGQRQGLAARRLDPRDQVMQPIGAPAGDRDRDAGQGQGQGRGLADPRGCAGDQRDLA